MRFVGALAIVLTHVTFQTGLHGPNLTGTFLSRLDIGVAIFFVLSGFLLSRPYFSRMASRNALPKIKFYLWKRALRILPVYLLTVITVLTLVPESRGSFHPDWTQNLTLTVLYGSETLPQGLTQMWSLATEVAFYLTLPALMAIAAAIICRGRWRPTVLLVSLLILSMLSILWLSTVELQTYRALWLPASSSWFAGGMAIAVASVDLEMGSRARSTVFIGRLGCAPGSLLVLAAALLLIASTSLAGPVFGDVATHEEAVTKNILYAVIGMLLILPGVFADPAHVFTRIMSHPALRYLGRISYGVFCVHLLVLHYVLAWRHIEVFTGHFVEVLVLTLVGTLGLSAIIFRFIETPLNRFKTFGRPRTEPATKPSETAIAN